ncbi:MAG TPA: DUF4386 family protein [Nitrososphaerales archaeon]|nr:DUF4386 family protein [Nitrososphaerales archaeon]
MVSNLGGSSTPQDGWKPLAIFGFAAGLFLIAFIVANGSWVKPSPDLMLATFQSNTAGVDLTGVNLGIAVAAAIPFFALLGTSLRSRGPGLALGATLLISIGFAVIALSTAIFVAVLNGIVNAGNAPASTDAAYQAAIWEGAYQTSGYLGLALSGLGLILFGLLMWKSKVYPNWLAVICFIGGVGGFVSLIGILDIINGVALLILFFGVAVMVVRGRTKASG